MRVAHHIEVYLGAQRMSARSQGIIQHVYLYLRLSSTLTWQKCVCMVLRESPSSAAVHEIAGCNKGRLERKDSRSILFSIIFMAGHFKNLQQLFKL
jgi:hypothetical protein